MANLKIDLEQDEVFVFTPKGRVITLPVGATPVDFAYAIHTEVGHACIGARVNGRLVPLDSPVASGDTIEIFTSKVEGAGPSQDWLKFVRTHRAAQQDPPVVLAGAARGRHRDRHATSWCKALRREGLPVQKIQSSKTAATRSPSRSTTSTSTPSRPPSARATCRRTRWPSGCVATSRTSTPPARSSCRSSVRDAERARRRHGGNTAGVHVEGLDDVMVRLSRCCTPVPGDPIMGFVTRGRGVSVHRTDCANAVSLAVGQADRLIEVEWDEDRTGTFVASIEVKALDRSRLLRDVSAVLAEPT